MRERGAQLAEGSEVGAVKAGQVLQKRSRRHIVAARMRARKQHPPCGDRRGGIEIDQLALFQERSEWWSAGLFGSQSRGRGRVFQLNGMTQQPVQQSCRRGWCRRRIGLGLRQRRIGEQCGDVIGFERWNAIERSRLYQRYIHGQLRLGIRRIFQARMPAEAERVQHRTRQRVLRAEPAARVQVLAQEAA
jgi:hypothetical protein